jgi:hypothetical protein
MAEVLRALLIKPGGVVRLATVTKTAGVVYLTYVSKKLMRGGRLVSLSVEGAKTSDPRKLTDSERKQAATIEIDGKKVLASGCFEMELEGKTHIVVPV